MPMTQVELGLWTYIVAVVYDGGANARRTCNDGGWWWPLWKLVGFGHVVGVHAMMVAKSLGCHM